MGCSSKGPSNNVPSGPITQTPGFLSTSDLDLRKIDISVSNPTSKCFPSTFKYHGQKNQIGYLEDWYKQIGLGGSIMWSQNYYSKNEEIMVILTV